MSEQKPSVNVPGSDPQTPKPEVDDKGVSWENRAKEMERKLKAAEARANELAQKVETTKPQPSVDERKAAVERRLMEFVEDPDNYLERHYQERKFRDELPEAEQWLRTQEGYSPEDDSRIGAIIQEHGLNQPSPKLRAKAAWKILKAEKLEREFSDKKREDRVSKSAPDGNGRSTPTNSGKPSRADLLKDLRKSRNAQEQAAILGKLEDTR